MDNYPVIGMPTDPMDHEADSGHNASYAKGRAESMMRSIEGSQNSSLLRKVQAEQSQEISDSVPRTGNTRSTNYTVQPK